MKKEFVNLPQLYKDVAVKFRIDPKYTDIKQLIIQAACPFCKDRGHHLGINLNKNAYNCFKCPAHGKATDLFKMFGILFRLKDSIQITDIPDFETPVIAIPQDKFVNKDVYRKYEAYMSYRGFNPSFLKDKFDIWPVTNDQNYYYGYVIYKINSHAFYARKFLKLDDKHPKHIIRNNKKDDKSKMYSFYDSRKSGIILVVESVFNMMKAAQFDYSAVCIFGKSKVGSFCEFMRNYDRDKKICFAFDSDVKLKEIEDFYTRACKEVGHFDAYYINPRSLGADDIADLKTKNDLENAVLGMKSMTNIFLDSFDIGE